MFTTACKRKESYCPLPDIKKHLLWAVHHSDKLPIKGVYSRQSALKMLEIHQVFLRFLP